MIHIDHFALFNDSYGHPDGDAVLQQIAHLLGRKLRPGDFLVRYGGEEFLILLSGFGGDAARVVAERAKQ